LKNLQGAKKKINGAKISLDRQKDSTTESLKMRISNKKIVKITILVHKIMIVYFKKKRNF